MLPFCIGTFSAAIFGVGSYLVYGAEGVTAHGWIHMVFWALIGAGALVTLVNKYQGCLLCRMVRLAHADRLEHRLCGNLACV